jgi:hypothetical protein
LGHEHQEVIEGFKPEKMLGKMFAGVAFLRWQMRRMPLTSRRTSGIQQGDIAWTVASITEGDLGIASEKSSFNALG